MLTIHQYFGLLLVLVLTTAWFALPLLPAIQALREKRGEALFIPKDDLQDADYFGASLLRRVEARQSEIAAASRSGSAEIDLDGETYVVKAPGGVAARMDSPCLVVGDASLPDLSRTRKLCATGAIDAGGGGLHASLCASGSISLGKGTAVDDWVHAGADLTVGEQCSLGERASAGGALRLGAGTRFRRLSAPRIESLADMPPLCGEGGTVEPGGLRIEAGSRMSGPIVAKSGVVIGKQARLLGGVKAGGRLRVEAGVEALGALMATDITFGAGCRVHGPVVADGDIVIGGGCVIGSPDRPTTVSAARVWLGAGAVVHGAIWAREGGRA